MRATIAMGAVLCLLAVALAPPMAGANHCETRIHVFGRSTFAPTPPAPYSGGLAAAMCPRATDVEQTHALPPQTDQILVRIDGDFGPSVPTVLVELTGLGFAGSTFVLNRTASDLGGHTFAMGGWAFAPDPRALDGITVTAYYPETTMRTTWHSTPPFVPLPPPPDPGNVEIDPDLS